MRTITGRRFAIRAGSAVLAMGLLAGCSGAGSGGSEADRGGAPADSRAASAPTPAAGESAVGESAGRVSEGTQQKAPQVGEPTNDGQRKISRAEVTVTVEDLTEASATVRGLAATHGGFVSSESVALSQASSVDNAASSSSYRSGGDERGTSYRSEPTPDSTYPTEAYPTEPVLWAQPGEARIVLRVAPDQTEATMDAIAGVGEETSRWRTDTNVELQMVDLESRIATQTQSIADLRLLMAKATTVGEIITVEQEISTRTANLESLKAQQASLSDATAHSTVTAVLRTPERNEQAGSEAGFLGGLKAGWNALLRSLQVLLTFIGAVLPFAVLALVAWYPIRRWLRPRLAQWRARRREARTALQEQQRAQAQQWQHAHSGAPARTPGAAPTPPPTRTERPDDSAGQGT